MKNLETVFVVTLVLVVFAPIWVRALGWWYEFLSDNIDTILSFFRKKALTLDEAIHSRGERARTVLANSVQNLRDEAVRLKSSESLLIEKLSQSEAGWHKRTRIHQELSDKFESLQDEISDIREAREKAENELAHVVSEASREREVSLIELRMLRMSWIFLVQSWLSQQKSAMNWLNRSKESLLPTLHLKHVCRPWINSAGTPLLGD